MKHALRIAMFLLMVSGLYAVPTVQLVQPANMATNVSRPVVFNWNISPQSTVAYQYEIQVAYDSTFGWVLYDFITNNRNYTAGGLANAQLMYWRVIIKSPSDPNDFAESSIFQFTTEANTPGCPVLIKPAYHQERIARGGTQFDWSPIANANFYEIMISTSGLFFNDTNKYKTEYLPFTYSKVFEYSSVYYWRVRAGFTNTNDTIYSDWSKTGIFRTESQFGPPELRAPFDSAEFTTNDLDYYFSWNGGGMNNYFAFSADSDMFDVGGALIPPNGYHSFSRRLNPGKYYWRVQIGAVDNPNQQYPKYYVSDWSETRCIIVKQVPINYINPIYPIQDYYRATPLDTIISWTAVPNAINYEFEMHSDSTQTGIITLTENQYHAANLYSDAYYYWHVRAKYLLDGDETYTAWFGYWSFYTADTITILPTPNKIYPLDGIKYSGIPEDTYFQWHPVRRANLYQLQLAYDSTFTTIITEKFGSDTIYHDLQIFPNNTTVYWRIKALYNVGETNFKHSYWSDIYSFTTSYEFPNYPQTIYPANGATNLPQEITLVWTPLPNAVSYRIRINYPDNYYYDEYPYELYSTTNTLTFTYTKPNSTFSWYVSASAANGYGSGVQPEPWTFTTGNFDSGVCPPIAPPNGANFESSNVYVEWTANPNAESYRFQLAQQSTIIPKVLISQNMLFSENSTIVMDTLMTNNSINLSLNGIDQTYYWRVYANLKNGDSTCWSDQWKFTVNATNYVELNHENLAIQVYTNNDLLTVRQDEKYFEQAKFEIFNISGELIKDLGTQYFNNNSIEFNLSELLSGKYWLKISSDKYAKYYNFVVLR